MIKKITTKVDTGEGDEVVSKITADTKILFTVKSFIATIATILGIFYGFYTLVIAPTEKRFEAMFNDQKAQNVIYYQELGKINGSIGALNATVQALNNEKSNKSDVPNTGGGLSSKTTTNTEKNDGLLTSNK